MMAFDTILVIEPTVVTMNACPTRFQVKKIDNSYYLIMDECRSMQVHNKNFKKYKILDENNNLELDVLLSNPELEIKNEIKDNKVYAVYNEEEIEKKYFLKDNNKNNTIIKHLKNLFHKIRSENYNNKKCPTNKPQIP